MRNKKNQSRGFFIQFSEGISKKCFYKKFLWSIPRDFYNFFEGFLINILVNQSRGVFIKCF